MNPHDRSQLNRVYIDGLMQKRRNSSADALELRFFCIKPSRLSNKDFSKGVQRIPEASQIGCP